MPNVKISKEQIFNTAVKMFLQDGYETTTIRSIAKELGISHGSIFNYFSNKCEIGLSITESFFDSWQNAADKYFDARTSVNSLDKFAFLSVTYAQFMSVYRSFASFLCDFLSTNQATFLAAYKSHLTEYVLFQAKAYKQNRAKASTDIYLLNTASLHLTRLLLSNEVSIEEAAIYMTNLDNFLWSLGETEDNVDQAVARTFELSDDVNGAVKSIADDLGLTDILRPSNS
jgi:AcrR family transcriptional regulator